MRNFFMGFTLLLILFSSAIAQSRTIVLTDSNTVIMRQAFTSLSVSALQNELFNKVNKQWVKNPIYLYLRTPGGSIDAGQTLIDSINALPVPVHTITSFAASMGYNTVQLVKGKRLIVPNGVLMSHRAYGGFEGQFPGELNNRLNFYTRQIELKDMQIAKRIGLTLEQYKRLVWDEYWVGSQDAITQRQADEIVDIVCDKSLLGAKEEIFQTFFGPVKVTFSKCPIIHAPLKVDLSSIKLNLQNMYEREKYIELTTFFDLMSNDIVTFFNKYVKTNKIKTILK